MNKVVFLDSGPLGLLSASPKKMSAATVCARWMSGLTRRGVRVIVPEIIDYEVRRELLRANKTSSIARLDSTAAMTEYLPLSTVAMRKAAELWALARKAGLPTSGDKNIDSDVILAAQVLTLGEPNTVIATTNVCHLSRFVTAEEWHLITP